MIITAFLCISRHDHITNDELKARSGQMLQDSRQPDQLVWP